MKASPEKICKRATALILAFALSVGILGAAQEMPITGIPVSSGKLYYTRLTNPGDQIALKCIYVFPFVVGTGDPTITIDIYKTHSWDGSQLNPITPVPVWDVGSFPSSGGERNIDLLTPFYDAIDSETGNDRFGRWQVRLRHYSSGSPSGQIFVYDNQLTSLESYDAAGQSLGDLFGGSVPGGNGASDEPGFWGNLFIPSQTSLDNLQRAAGGLGEWGPFGIYTAVQGAAQYYADNPADQFDEGDQYVIGTSIVILGNTIPMEIDLYPYRHTIKFARAIMAGGMWVIVIFAAFKRIYQKA